MEGEDGAGVGAKEVGGEAEEERVLEAAAGQGDGEAGVATGDIADHVGDGEVEAEGGESDGGGGQNVGGEVGEGVIFR